MISTKINILIEKIIIKLKLPLINSENNVFDFKINDIVECTYINGLFKIKDIHYKNRICFLKNLNNSKNLEIVRVEFLNKVKVNSKSIGVLFDD